PTMTAEAWACRQFLGVGGPGPASTEAADYLLAHGPRSDTYNLYYWYYGTLAMYPHRRHAWDRREPPARHQLLPRHPPPGHRPRELGPRRQPLRRQGGPDLLHRPGRAVAGGLLPVPPSLRRARHPPRRRPRPPPRRRP